MCAFSGANPSTDPRTSGFSPAWEGRCAISVNKFVSRLYYRHLPPQSPSGICNGGERVRARRRPFLHAPRQANNASWRWRPMLGCHRFCIFAQYVHRDARQRKREGRKSNGREEKAGECEESGIINREFSLLERATSDSQSFDHSNGDQTKKLDVAASRKQRIDPIISFRFIFFLSLAIGQPQKCNAVYMGSTRY